MWVIKIFSKNKIEERERELIVEYANSEGDNIILHDVLETRKSLELLIEAKKKDIEKLFSILQYDFGNNWNGWDFIFNTYVKNI